MRTRESRGVAAGKALRAKVPRSSHAAWRPPARRKNPVDLLVASSEGRVPELVPIRYGRMLASPFAFYRGAAAVMAADLASTPASGLRTQVCGDCHLANFGGFATPERRQVFDLNDFDETLPAPWEWDLKRLTASFVIASRHNGLKRSQTLEAAMACSANYRKWMRRFAEQHPLDVWYASIDAEAAVASFRSAKTKRRVWERVEKARKQHAFEADFPKLAHVKNGAARISDNPPLIFHPRESESAGFKKSVKDTFASYRASLPEDRRRILDRFVIADIAQKVVGVGSVGTRCGILLMIADGASPLFLQVKEARTSVLEPYAGASEYANRGQRVVIGQRLMQSSSDVFLGWTEGAAGRHFYLRQLRDMKIKPLIELYDAGEMIEYATLCGWALARAHARSGDPATIAGYVGKSGALDEALATFSEQYADQNERDYGALKQAVKSGKIEAFVEAKE